MEAAARFSELVAGPESAILLDEASLCIAALDHEVDFDGARGHLDSLSAQAPSNASELAQQLFGPDGFLGNEINYLDVRNSFLDDVLKRRIGIPITMSIVMMEVGRRAGIPLVGVGMPGHFLVRDEAGIFYDPFFGGVALDVAACRQRFDRLRPRAKFLPEYLAPIGTRAILARVLANLIPAYFKSGSVPAVVGVIRLRLSIPDLSAADRADGARILADLGLASEAAAVLDDLADEADSAQGARFSQQATAYRARDN